MAPMVPSIAARHLALQHEIGGPELTALQHGAHCSSEAVSDQVSSDDAEE